MLIPRSPRPHEYFKRVAKWKCRCNLCGRDINKGATYYYRPVGEGFRYQARACKRCLKMYSLDIYTVER